MDERTKAILARAERALAPRDPVTVARAAAWEAGSPKPERLAPMSRNTDGFSASTPRPQPARQPARRSAPGVTMPVLEALAREIGSEVAAVYKRLEAAEARNATLLSRILEMEQQLAGRLVTPVPKMIEGRRYDA